jgi:hypothetical protein
LWVLVQPQLLLLKLQRLHTLRDLQLPHLQLLRQLRLSAVLVAYAAQMLTTQLA